MNDETEIGRLVTCSRCGHTFHSTWTKAEALAEHDRIFGAAPEDECEVVCDDCFQKLMAHFN